MQLLKERDSQLRQGDEEEEVGDHLLSLPLEPAEILERIIIITQIT